MSKHGKYNLMVVLPKDCGFNQGDMVSVGPVEDSETAETAVARMNRRLERLETKILGKEEIAKLAREIATSVVDGV